MNKESITFGKIKIEKREYFKYQILIDDLDITKILMSLKKYKYFIGNKNEEKVKPSCVILPKMSECARHFDKTKCMSFFIEDDELLEKYKELWKKGSDSIK